MRRGDRCIGRAKECSGLALLWVGIKAISDVIQGSLFTLLVAANGARYWMLFLRLWGILKKQKAPVVAGGDG